LERIIAVAEQNFERQDLGNGLVRWTAVDLFEQHKAQVTIVAYGGGHEIRPHSHTVDEVFYVLEGELDLGAEILPARSVLSVGAQTAYGFRIGADGARWLRICPDRPPTDRTATDTQMADPEAARPDRVRRVAAPEIAGKAWDAVDGNPALRQRSLIAEPGYPAVALHEVGPENARALACPTAASSTWSTASCAWTVGCTRRVRSSRFRPGCPSCRRPRAIGPRS
jgi:hypothetical protein